MFVIEIRCFGNVFVFIHRTFTYNPPVYFVKSYSRFRFQSNDILIFLWILLDGPENNSECYFYSATS